MYVGLFVFCLFILKAHGLRSMGLGAVRLFKKPHPAQWVGLFVFCLWGGVGRFLFIYLKSPWTAFHGARCFLILTEKYSNLLSISSSIVLLIN